MTEHTVVVRFPEGVEPAYYKDTSVLGGELVAVAFDGNRLAVEHELAEALDQALTSMLDSGYSKDAVVVRTAKQALKKAGVMS